MFNLSRLLITKSPIHNDDYEQGSYESWKSWKVLEFYSGNFQDFQLMQVLESPGNL